MRSLPSTRFSSSGAADAFAGTRPDGAVRAGTGAAFAGAAVSVGAAQSAGTAGAYRAGQAFVRHIGREGRERIGRVSVRRSVMCREVDPEAIGQEVVGRAATVPEPVGRAAAVLERADRAAAVPEPAVVAAAAVPEAIGVVATGNPALMPVL